LENVWRNTTHGRRNVATFHDVTSRSGRLTRLATTAALLGLLASACASGGSGAPSAAPPATTSSATEPSGTIPIGSPTTEPGNGDGTPATTPSVPVPEALQFSAPLVGGGEFTGADYADKPTVFWFWAPT
jgi:hypothetical protein